MKNLSAIFFILILINSFGCKPVDRDKQELQSKHTKLSNQLDEYFNALLELKQFNGVVLIEKEGQVILRKAYNLEDKTNESLFVTTEHQFDLRSISKLIAKYSLKKMEVSGLLSTDDTIDKYLKDFPNGDKITLNHLMNNQSGLPREFTDEDNLNLFELNPDEIVDLIKKEALEFEPGTETQYSNLGFQLVYYIIGQLHSKTFAQYVQDEVFDFLKMKDSGAHFYTNQNNLKTFAKYHVQDDKGQIVNIEHHEKGSKKQAKLFSTIDDLNKLLHEFQQESYNKELSSPSGIIGHSGGSEGIRSHIQTNTKQDYSFIFLANYDKIPFTDIIKTIEKILESKPYTIPTKLNRKAVEISDSQIKKYVGTYDFKDANHITFEFKFENGGLVAYQDGELRGPLFAENDSLFFWEATNTESVEFQQDDNGNYKAMMDIFGATWEGTRVE